MVASTTETGYCLPGGAVICENETRLADGVAALRGKAVQTWPTDSPGCGLPSRFWRCGPTGGETAVSRVSGSQGRYGLEGAGARRPRLVTQMRDRGGFRDPA